MKRLHALITKLARDESGQDLIEYALAACLLSLCAIASMRTLATSISSMFNYVGTGVTGAI